jgi:hypothetical protein
MRQKAMDRLLGLIAQLIAKEHLKRCHAEPAPTTKKSSKVKTPRK